jgi:phosphohistidine phosphatase
MSMDLILWRHAQAEDTCADGDMERALTARGQKQAARVGAWLAKQLPDDARILCSPARRCQQTAKALGRRYELEDSLAPGNAAADLLQAAGWPAAGQPIVVVGHQPTLGETVAQLLGLDPGACAVRKGAVWWLRTETHNGRHETKVVAVQSSDTV